MTDNPMLGVGEVADLIGLKRATVYVMHSTGKLPPPDAVVNDGRTKLWFRSTIKTWNDERTKA